MHWTIYRREWELLVGSASAQDAPWQFRSYGSRVDCESRLRSFGAWVESGRDAESFFRAP